MTVHIDHKTSVLSQSIHPPRVNKKLQYLSLSFSSALWVWRTGILQQTHLRSHKTEQTILFAFSFHSRVRSLRSNKNPNAFSHIANLQWLVIIYISRSVCIAQPLHNND